MAFGRGSITLPSTSIASSFDIIPDLSQDLPRCHSLPRRLKPPAHRAGLPGKEVFFCRCAPHPRPQGGACGMRSRSLNPAEDIRSVFRHRDGMFKMGGKFTVRGDHRPAIRENLHFVTTLVDHRLYRQDHPRFKLYPSSPDAVIGYLRIFMEAPAYAMPDKIPDDRKPCRFDRFLNGSGNISQAVAGSSLSDGVVQN